jgi:hypothetical protein
MKSKYCPGGATSGESGPWTDRVFGVRLMMPSVAEWAPPPTERMLTFTTRPASRVTMVKARP